MGPGVELILKDGDLLYIPRGHWHAANALDGPTLHLTFGINNKTGIDLLIWLEDELRNNEIFRMDLPRFSEIQEQEQHFRALTEALVSMWNAEIFSRFFAHHDSRATPRPRTSLPWSAERIILPGDQDPILSGNVVTDINLKLDSCGAAIEFSANGRNWRFASDVHPMLERFGCTAYPS